MIRQQTEKVEETKKEMIERLKTEKKEYALRTRKEVEEKRQGAHWRPEGKGGNGSKIRIPIEGTDKRRSDILTPAKIKEDHPCEESYGEIEIDCCNNETDDDKVEEQQNNETEKRDEEEERNKTGEEREGN